MMAALVALLLWFHWVWLKRFTITFFCSTMGSSLCGGIRVVTRQEDEQQKQIYESVEQWASSFCVYVHKSTASTSQRGLWSFKMTIKLRMWISEGGLSWLAVRELTKSQSKRAKCNYVFRLAMTCRGGRTLSAAADRTVIILEKKWNNWRMKNAGPSLYCQMPSNNAVVFLSASVIVR